MEFIENSSRYQRPATNVEEGTCYLGDIEGQLFGTTDDQMFEALRDFDPGLQSVEDFDIVGGVDGDADEQQDTSSEQTEVDDGGYRQLKVTKEPTLDDEKWWQ